MRHTCPIPSRLSTWIPSIVSWDHDELRVRFYLLSIYEELAEIPLSFINLLNRNNQLVCLFHSTNIYKRFTVPDLEIRVKSSDTTPTLLSPWWAGH